MKERPILFSSAMMRAILEGRKTQTRRVVKNVPLRTTEVICFGDEWLARDEGGVADANPSRRIRCPYGKPGDRLYVKESAWMWCERSPNGKTKTGRVKWHYAPLRSAPVFYVADGHKPSTQVVSPDTSNEWGWRFKVARFLPHWASRFTLEITDVRVQRLQDISVEDCMAEGITRSDALQFSGGYVAAFESLWNSINGEGSWDANNWVFALTFKAMEATR